MGHEANVAERDVTENRRFGVAPSLALGLGTANRLTASYFHFNENDIPDYGIPWYFNRAAPVPRHNYYGFRDGNYLRTDVDMVTLKMEHDIGDWAILRNRARFANNQRDARITEPQLNNATAGSDHAGHSARPDCRQPQPDCHLQQRRPALGPARCHGTPEDLRRSSRRSDWRRRRPRNFRSCAAHLQLRKRRRRNHQYRAHTNLLAPNESQSFSGISAPSSNVHVTSTSYGLYLLDTMQFGNHFGSWWAAHASTAF